MEQFVETYCHMTQKSEALFRRARQVMPGGISHNVHFFAPYPIFLQRAEGSKIWDVDGNEYIDLWMGHYTHFLGHHPEPIVSAIAAQLREGIHWGIVFEKMVEWADLIHQLIPSAEMVRFCCSGTEATMYAVRLARAFTGKKIVLKIAGGWHGGNSDLCFGIKRPYERDEGLGFLPELAKYAKAIPFNDLPGSLKIIHESGRDLAGIILELMPGEGGFVPAHPEYLKMLRAETQKVGGLLIFDEVITGFRAALGGAQERLGFLPDLTTLGKIVGGGMPVGALVGRKEILERTSPERKVSKWERILIGGGTFSSHPLTAAAGLAMLRYLKAHRNEIYPSLEAKGDQLRRGMEEALRSEGIDAVATGVGSFVQTQFPLKKGKAIDSPHAIHQFTDIEKREWEFRIRMLTKGVYVMHGGGGLSMAHSDEDLEKIILATKEVAREMGSASQKGSKVRG